MLLPRYERPSYTPILNKAQNYHIQSSNLVATSHYQYGQKVIHLITCCKSVMNHEIILRV